MIRGGDGGVVDQSRRSPLHYAVEKGLTRIVQVKVMVMVMVTMVKMVTMVMLVEYSTCRPFWKTVKPTLKARTEMVKR